VSIKGSHSWNRFFGVRYGMVLASGCWPGSRRRSRWNRISPRVRSISPRTKRFGHAGSTAKVWPSRAAALRSLVRRRKITVPRSGVCRSSPHSAGKGFLAGSSSTDPNGSEGARRGPRRRENASQRSTPHRHSDGWQRPCGILPAISTSYEARAALATTAIEGRGEKPQTGSPSTGSRANS